MAHRYFSADFHFGMESLMKIERWPFNTIKEHDDALVRSCVERTNPNDIIYHIGDLATFKVDNNKTIVKNLEIKPYTMLKDVPATFINIRGNHDLHNKVKSACESMMIYLNKRFPQVSLSHYPTYDYRIDQSCLCAPIHLCGHVHNAWKYCLDLDHRILNINVGCMQWGFKIISDEELIIYLNEIFKKSPDNLFRCHNNYGKIVFFKER